MRLKIRNSEIFTLELIQVRHQKSTSQQKLLFWYAYTYKIVLVHINIIAFSFLLFFICEYISDQIFVLKKLIHNPHLINKTVHQFRCKTKMAFRRLKVQISLTANNYNKDYTTNYKQTSNSVSEDSNFENRALQSPNAP